MQAEELRAVNVDNGEGDPYWFTNNRMTVKVRAADTDGAFGVVEGVGPAGSSPPLHVHHREHELFLLLEGSLTVRCGEETFRAEPGSVTFLPRGVPHTFRVEGEKSARLLSICVPGGFEEFFVAAGRPAENDGLPPNEPPDITLLRRVGTDFGQEIVGPPLAPSGKPARPGAPTAPPVDDRNGAIRLQRLDHVSLNVTDRARSIAWYRDVLGVQQLNQPNGDDEPVFLGEPGLQFGLFQAQRESPSREPESSGLRHIALVVDDLSAAQQRLRELGVPFNYEDHGNALSVYLRDPDDHVLELTTYVR